jgi:hypothetical protein
VTTVEVLADGEVRTSPLSEGEIRSFLRKGFLFPGRVLSTAQVDALRERVDALLAAGTGGYVPDNIWDVHTHDELFRELRFDRRLAGWAGQLLDTDRVAAVGDTVLVKPPAKVKVLDWHQDWTNWPISEPEALTIWIALDDVTLEKGAMEFAVGTHALGRFLGSILEAGAPADSYAARRDELGLVEMPNPSDLGLEIQPVEVKAGECSIHHGLTWHHSGTNHTTEPRRAVAERYADAHLTFTGMPISALVVPHVAPTFQPEDIGKKLTDIDVYPVIEVPPER